MKITWTVHYLSTDTGFECSISISGDDLAEVLAKGRETLQKMRLNGVRPVRTRPIPPEPHRRI